MLPYLMIGSDRVSMYSLVNSLAPIAAVIFNLCLFRQKTVLLSAYSRIFLWKRTTTIVAIVVIVETTLLSLAQYYLGSVCNSFWAKLLVGSGANYFGLVYWSPPLFLLVCMLVRVNPLKQLDLFTPSYAMALVIFKIACFFHGCCQGKPWKYGLYFVSRERYEFPSQLLELTVAFAMLLILAHLLRKPRTPGSLFPFYLILYSATRFFTEFTRAGDIVLLGLQSYQLQCLAGMLLGYFELVVVKRFGQKWSDDFDQKQERFIQSKTKGASQSE